MSTPRPITLCIVEDDAMIRESLGALFALRPELKVLAILRNGEEAMEQLPDLAPDVTIMDISMPGLSGIECVRELAPLMPGTRFLMYTMHDDDKRVFDALKAGAHGYILKNSSSDRIAEAVEELMNDGAPMSAAVAKRVIAHFHQPAQALGDLQGLSARESAVLELLAKGLLYKEIGNRLGISTNTVGQHAFHLYKKLHVKNRTEAANRYFGR